MHASKHGYMYPGEYLKDARNFLEKQPTSTTQSFVSNGGYTRESVAEKATISPKFLYEIEMGKKGFSAVVLLKLCSVLRVDCDYILTGKEKAIYDQTLLEVIQLFNSTQTKRISIILKGIYDLL